MPDEVRSLIREVQTVSITPVDRETGRRDPGGRGTLGCNGRSRGALVHREQVQ